MYFRVRNVTKEFLKLTQGKHSLVSMRSIPGYLFVLISNIFVVHADMLSRHLASVKVLHLLRKVLETGKRLCNAFKSMNIALLVKNPQ